MTDHIKQAEACERAAEACDSWLMNFGTNPEMGRLIEQTTAHRDNLRAAAATLRSFAHPALSIPPCVYWNAEHNNFYSFQGEGMGQRFYEQWADQSHKFPTTPLAQPAPPPADLAELVAWLDTQAKSKRDFVAHAEANRDDWYATMPPEISEDALKEAAMYEAISARLAEQAAALAAYRAAVENVREAIQYEQSYKSLGEAINALEPQLTTALATDAGKDALEIVREMMAHIDGMAEAFGDGPDERALKEAARRTFGEGGGG